MLRNRIDFRPYCFEIRDEEGRLLLEAPFDERLNSPVRHPSDDADLPGLIEATRTQNRRLRGEVAGGVDEARMRVSSLHATLQRTRGGSPFTV